jgi:CheY-like chemotaxis protein
MGGTIGFDSEVGAGSVFWFEIPLTVGTSVAESAAPALDTLTDLRVLVVDDNATNRMILERQLSSWQLRPDVVDNAPAALAQLRSGAEQGEPYAVAVLDMCMPDVDGLQLARQVSADPSLSGTRMIMLTSTSELEPTVLARAGIAEWLLKPVRSSELRDRLQRLMAPPAPVAQTAPAAPRAGVVAPASGRVLVVEDNPLNQLVAEGIVRALGYQVDIVDNGAEALRAVLHTSYLAVLMDCHMPVLDGFEATREIRRREGVGARIPVIAMTAGAMAEDRDRCAAAGMDDFVSKPVTLASVGAALSRWTVGDAVPSAPTPSWLPGTERPLWDDEPALDLNRVTQLRQLGSMAGSDLLGRVVGLFARDAETSLDAIREAVDSHSAACLTQALHKLKGASANMGANRVAALCRQLEDQTADVTGSTTHAGPLLASQQLDLLTDEVAAVRRAIAHAI